MQPVNKITLSKYLKKEVKTAYENKKLIMLKIDIIVDKRKLQQSRYTKI